MTATGVLPFIRGIDFSHNDLSADNFPHQVAEMTQMTWLKLNRANLDRVPDELSRLPNLEHLQMSHNSLTSVHGELSDLPCLRSVIVRHNQIKTSGVPTDIFRMRDLTIIDFSHNSLKEVPTNLEYAKGTIVLNLSHNAIESISNQVFSKLIDLLYLDLSHNKLEMLPPQVRRMSELRVLDLSHNSLLHFQLKQLPSLTSLRVLNLRNTQRTLQNIPPTLDDMDNLQDIDLAMNGLVQVPDALLKLNKLRKLDLSDNDITIIGDVSWTQMETLNLSRNKLKSLPEALVRMTRLKKFYVSQNQLDFQGIPAGIGKLIQLEVFHAAYNNLELIPEGVTRCAKLRKIKLNNNRLVTLPETIHLLPVLQELDVHNNPDLTMPPKPTEKHPSLAFYNIDFSLSNQLKLAGRSPVSSISSNPTAISLQHKDPVARKIQFLKRRKHRADADDNAVKVIEGMSHFANRRERIRENPTEQSSLQPPTWKEAVERQKPAIDYSDLFDENVGQSEGQWVWEIENFYPNMLDSAFHGNFYEADCYLVLRTFQDNSGGSKHLIFYWIGSKTTLDKGMCAAVHAVNLRNHLGASCRTEREEMNEESDQFLELFGDEIVYIEGGRTSSGFFKVEKEQFPTRLYRIDVVGNHIFVQPVALSTDSLDPRFVFLLDFGARIFVWAGRNSRITVANKTRLFAVRMSKNDRKGTAEIESCSQSSTPEDFWKALTGFPNEPEEPIVEHVPLNSRNRRPRLYTVQLGVGFIELPQVDLKFNWQLRRKLLDTKNVYLLDCDTDVYLWSGKRATRLLKMAGQKMAVELLAIIERPNHSMLNRETEDEETTVFKSKFVDWDDIVPFDFTRTADSVQRRGADIKVLLDRDRLRTDLSALFLDRQRPMCDQESAMLMDECNEDLELMEPFVLEGRKFIKLPDDEFGTFFSMDCYVFLCRYYVPPDDGEVDDEMEEEEKEEGKNEQEESDEDEDGRGRSVVMELDPRNSPLRCIISQTSRGRRDDFQCVVYFWQGRDASNMGWLTFTFSLQKKFESLFKDKLEVVRMYQQQENHKFLSHFNKKFVIRRGRRGLTLNLGGRWPELFHVRANGSSLCTRTIQIDCKATSLNSAFCYILRVPFRNAGHQGAMGKIYIWVGVKTVAEQLAVASSVAAEPINKLTQYPLQTVQEGQEPTEFWDQFQGGQGDYEKDATFMDYQRLFRCSNEKGFFSISEKTVDFCQDDLDDDDVMILDTGEYVFLWIGSKASEVEIKLAYKAVKHLRLKQPDHQRRLMVTLKSKETKLFTRCFHAWGKHKLPAGD